MSVATPHDAIEEAIRSCDQLRSHLRQGNRQVRSAEERTAIKSMAGAWFRSLRKQLADIAASGLPGIDAHYHVLLEWAERNTTRDRYVDELAALKTALVALRSRVLVSPAQPPAKRERVPDFAPLIADRSMQDILARRWEETTRCLDARAPLAATVMMGGLLEALLLARINRVNPLQPVFTAKTAPRDEEGKTLRLRDWGLRDYIDVSHELGWLTRSAKDVSAVVRDYRNYIHPVKEHTHQVAITDRDAQLFWTVVGELARQVIASC
jgi:hypothetical protein